MTSIHVEKSGIFSTVQDLGRNGHRANGIGPGGPMDPLAALIANILVGNDDRDAMIESHFPGPCLVFNKECVIAITGADLGPMIDGVAIRNWCAVRVRRGSRLSFSEKRTGNRAYIAIYGGLDSDNWLGSRSTNLKSRTGGVKGRCLVDGDELSSPGIVSDYCKITRECIVSRSVLPIYSRHPTVRICRGPEFEIMDDRSRVAFLNESFDITNSADRMGAWLKGPSLSPSRSSMVSTGVINGTVQLLPDGDPVLLLADHQITGGYPRIGQVITADLGLVGQLGPGDRVSFHEVSVREAQAAYFAQQADLNLLRVGCKFQAIAWKQ